ncbi:MAG: YgjV family protein [Clostridiales bacterium]|nr:YgjV family protein [Clostridiales bacterium]
MDIFSILTQILGFIGVLFFLISYQVKSNRKLFLMQTLGCLTFCIQFALFGAFSGCLSLIINMVRNTMLMKYETAKVVRWKGWVFIFSALCIVSAIFTWDGIISLLPLIGTILTTAACWTNNARKIRLANLCVNSPCMLIYDIFIHSWGGVLNESITIVSIIISIFRFGWSNLDGTEVTRSKNKLK